MSVSRRLNVALALIVVLMGTTAVAVAAPRQGRVRLVRLVAVQPEMLPAPATALMEPPDLAPAPAQKYLGLVAAPKYHFHHKHHRTLRKTCCGRCPPQKVILDVQDPCGRPVEVCVSIPGCCHGDPRVLKDRDILGRFSYTYRWQSGYKIDVVFRPRGDVVVHTWGR